MPPPIALALCVAFIAWLLVADSRRRQSVSFAMWIPWLMLFILCSRSLTLWFSVGGLDAATDPSEGTSLDGLFYLILIASSCSIAMWRGVKLNRLFAANIVITLFYLYFLLSVFWSDDPLASFKRCTKDFGIVMVVSLILSEKDPLESIRALYVRCACVLIPLSVLFIRYYPELGRVYGRAGETMFTGVTTQKNSLGEIVMIFGLFLVWDYLETREERKDRLWTGIPWDRVIVLVMGVWLLNISDSKTALMCLLLGLALMMRTGSLASPMVSKTVLFTVMCLPFLLLFAQQSMSTIAPLVEAMGRDLTFTGRTEIWKNVLDGTRVNPFIGAGFFNFWGGPRGAEVREAMNTPGLHSAHNGYLDLFLDGGIFGLGFLFLLLASQGLRLIRNEDQSRFQRLRFAVVVVAIVYNLSESTWARLVPTWFTTLLVLTDFRTVMAGRNRTGATVTAVRPAVRPTYKPRPVRAHVS
jgi:O-antigen ligase